MASLYKLIIHREDDIKSWRSMSEWSNIVKIWANVFETTFEQTVTKGLRAVFKQIILVALGAYFVRKYDHTVVHPPNPTKIKQFQLDDLKQLFFFRI